MAGLRTSSWGLRFSLGLVQADRSLESHTCHLRRCWGSHIPTPGLSFPFYTGCQCAGLPELVPGRRSAQSLGAPWNGGRGHPRPHLTVQKPRAICPPPHPAAPPQPRSEGRAKPPPRRPRPRGDSELMRGECSRVGVSKRRARRGGAAGRGGSACPRALSRQRAEAGEAAPGPTDPDTSSSGCLPARAGCQARAGGLDPGGRGSQEGLGWVLQQCWGCSPERKGPQRICSQGGDTCAVLCPSFPGQGQIIPSIITEHRLYASPWAGSWLEGQGLGVCGGTGGHLWPRGNWPACPQVVSAGSSRAERPPAAWC